MHPALHLVMAFDRFCPWGRRDDQVWKRLGNFLEANSGILFTLVTALPFFEASERLGPITRLQPASWITEGGLAIHTLCPDGTYQEDVDYSTVAGEVSGDPSTTMPLDPRALAVAYLEAAADTPRPRVIVGHPERDVALLSLSDHPVFFRPVHTPQLPFLTSLLRTLGELMDKGSAWPEAVLTEPVYPPMSSRWGAACRGPVSVRALEGRQP